ncbi:MCM DNA helicase complex subunit [Perkinsus olseni]|uniref:MCM DNA helicase complex subunit n=1 Tax=Perkinsus olseni TaxID=32597 RepID=A0A7J6N9K7_PEROL|nr:MCM DNA helicase complex subunit [Perkinsus olseni]
MHAKSRPVPKLTPEAIEEAITVFVKLRKDSATAAARGSSSLAVTIRTLYGIYRLAIANARLMLQDYVSKGDISVAEELILAARGTGDEREVEHPSRLHSDTLTISDMPAQSSSQDNNFTVPLHPAWSWFERYYYCRDCSKPANHREENRRRQNVEADVRIYY